MAWVEAHQDLASHPKTRRFARMLKISTPQAVGHLFMFWWWVMDYAEDGDLSKFDAIDIADSVQWDGDPEEFLKAMIECGPKDSAGFIEKHGEKLFIHDWQDYGGRYFEKREKNRLRQEKSRARKNVTRDSQGYSREEEIREDKRTEEKSTAEDTANPPTTPADAEAEVCVSFSEIFSCWNEKLGPLGFPCVLKKTPAREQSLRARMKVSADRKKLEWWAVLFDRVASSEFLNKAVKERSWFTLDWLLDENNLVKLLEGKYDNRAAKKIPERPVKSISEILARHRHSIDAEYVVKENESTEIV